jgi:Fe2+ or Zn2+ uptake regulation protein
MENLGSELPLSSLYRSLAVLEGAGIVTRHFGARGVTRYELAEWLTGHHHHLVCLDCGSVEDIALPQPYEEKVEELVEGIGAFASFTPLGHSLEVEGRCSRCA